MKKYLFIAALAALVFTACKKDEKAGSISFEGNGIVEAPWDGLDYTVTLHASGAWTAQIEGDIDLTVDPSQGNGEQDVNILVPKNLEAAPVEGTVRFVQKDGKEAVLTFKQENRTVSYGGYNYKVKKLKDGNFWFVENLRYVPEGKEVSDDLTKISNGIWYPIDAAQKKLTNNADTVAKKGYLYNIEAALCVAAGTVSTANCASYEGAQGVCPDGWHIPTLDEIAKLVGRVAVSKYDKTSTPGPVTTAPYYDATKQDALIAIANEDGFNVNTFDSFLSVTLTATTGSVVNTMTYYLSSTGYLKEVSGNLTFNNQFYGIMGNPKNGTCSGAAINYRSGVPVRCIENKVTE